MMYGHSNRFFDCTNNENNIVVLFCNYARNHQFMKLSWTKPERKERKPGLLERLKICPKPPEPPPRPPNKLEEFLQRLHDEGVMATREIISASMASFVSVGATQPFDVLKNDFLLKSTFHSVKPWYPFQFFNEMKLILASRGFGYFFKGHFEAQRESLFHTISMFYTYQRVYQELQNMEYIFTEYPNLCIFFSGFVSASISVLLLRPYAAIRNRSAHLKHLVQKYGPIITAYNLRYKEKWYHAFQGCPADFLYTGTLHGLRFLTYGKISEIMLARKPEEKHDIDDYFKHPDSMLAELEPKKVEKTLTNSEALLAGALSGLISDLAVHPVDVVNIRLKMGALERQLFRFDNTCRRFGQCMKVIWKKEKLTGFYRGLLPLVLKSSISTAVTFAVYEAVQQWLRIHLLAG